MVLDLGLPDMTGFELIERVKSEIGLRKLPIVVYTGKELTREEEARAAPRWRRRSSSRTRARPSGCSTRPRSSSTGSRPRCRRRKRRMLEQLHRTDPTLAGRKVLIVDDDVRNIFALTSSSSAAR